MLSEILEQHKTLLVKRDSYLLPNLEKIIGCVQTLEKEAGHDYFDGFIHKKLRKGQYLLQEGTVCRHLWFLENGLARVFYRKEDVEAIRYFYSSGEFMDSYCSSSQQVPSLVSIQLLEDSVVYAICRSTLKKLSIAYPAIAEIEELINQCHFIWLEQRNITIQHSSATEQYLHMLHQQAPLISRLSVTNIASYLGVSIETVSRIRKRIVQCQVMG